MASAEDVRYRLQLGDGFLNEARQNLTLGRWRSCVDNSQLSVENVARSVLALLGPVGRTQAVADISRQAVQDARFSSLLAPRVASLAELTEHLPWDVHVASDYGDELGRHTPWELFDEPSARDA